MIIFPFGFLGSSGGVPPVNLVLPIIALIGVNEFSYTPGEWDISVTSVAYEWFENAAASGVSTPTFTSSPGSEVFVRETATNPFGSITGDSNVYVPGSVTSSPIITQTMTDFVTYTTAGVYDGMTITSAVWTINGTPTVTPAVIAASFDATTIGAVNGDLLTVTETLSSFATQASNTLEYIALAHVFGEDAALNYVGIVSMIDSIPTVTEDAALNYEMSATLTDNRADIAENAGIVWTVTGSIV